MECNGKTAHEQIKDYNNSIISAGYFTFFGVLFFLEKNQPGPSVYLSLISMTFSAIIFAGHEIIRCILQAIGKDESFSEAWMFFFIPSLLFAVFGNILLVFILLSRFFIALGGV